MSDAQDRVVALQQAVAAASAELQTEKQLQMQHQQVVDQ